MWTNTEFNKEERREMSSIESLLPVKAKSGEKGTPPWGCNILLLGESRMISLLQPPRVLGLCPHSVQQGEGHMPVGLWRARALVALGDTAGTPRFSSAKDGEILARTSSCYAKEGEDGLDE